MVREKKTENVCKPQRTAESQTSFLLIDARKTTKKVLDLWLQEVLLHAVMSGDEDFYLPKTRNPDNKNNSCRPNKALKNYFKHKNLKR